jgi:hypothetical protein
MRVPANPDANWPDLFPLGSEALGPPGEGIDFGHVVGKNNRGGMGFARPFRTVAARRASEGFYPLAGASGCDVPGFVTASWSEDDE